MARDDANVDEYLPDRQLWQDPKDSRLLGNLLKLKGDELKKQNNHDAFVQKISNRNSRNWKPLLIGRIMKKN